MRSECTLYRFVSPHFLVDQMVLPDREKLNPRQATLYLSLTLVRHSGLRSMRSWEAARP